MSIVYPRTECPERFLDTKSPSGLAGKVETTQSTSPSCSRHAVQFQLCFRRCCIYQVKQVSLAGQRSTRVFSAAKRLAPRHGAPDLSSEMMLGSLVASERPGGIDNGTKRTPNRVVCLHPSTGFQRRERTCFDISCCRFSSLAIPQ